MVERQSASCAELGLKGSLERLHEECAPGGYRYAHSMLGCHADAEEVVQEAFCRLAKSQMPTEEPIIEARDEPFDQLRGVFFTTVRNLCIDILRRRKRIHSLSIESQLTKWEFEARAETDYSMQQLSSEIIRLIEQMPSDWAEALRLKITSEMTYEQMARVLGCTHAQVRTWIYRGRRHLVLELTKLGLISESSESQP
jgi:RNA polymerase sigma-70 factor (ECF subfamily)